MKYSIEDIYNLVGQFDYFSVFEFCYGSEACNQYGSSVWGNIIYRKKQRAALEEAIHTPNYARNDGVIFLDGNNEDGPIEQLKTIGFKASDVSRVMTSTLPHEVKQYRVEGTKEIPNTVNIPFDFSDVDILRLAFNNSKHKVEGSGGVLPHEWMEYFTYLYMINPDKLREEDKSTYLIDPKSGKFTEEVEYIIYSTKWEKLDITPEELYYYYYELLPKEEKARLSIIKQQLGISDAALAKFKAEYPEGHKELMGIVYHFQIETLSGFGVSHPVYWDYERFIHIFTRHYTNLMIPYSSALQSGKSPFQYTFKDISRLARIAVEQLEEEINDDLTHGREFRRYSDGGYYFNGNYYAIRITPEGRLTEFHPLHN